MASHLSTPCVHFSKPVLETIFDDINYGPTPFLPIGQQLEAQLLPVWSIGWLRCHGDSMEARLTRLTFFCLLMCFWIELTMWNSWFLHTLVFQVQENVRIIYNQAWRCLSPWLCRDRVDMFFVNIFVLFNCDKPVYIRKKKHVIRCIFVAIPQLNEAQFLYL